MKEMHANSEYVKKIKEEKVISVSDIPVDKQPEEPVTIVEPNSLQTDTYNAEGETYYLVDWKWEQVIRRYYNSNI